MYPIVEVQDLNPEVVRMVVEAPAIARKHQPGQFIILRIDETGERIPAKAVVLATGGLSYPSTGSTGDGLVMATDIGADTVFKGGFIGWKVVTPVYDQDILQTI